MSYPTWRLLPIGGTINAGLRVYSRIFSMYNDAGHSMPIVEIFYEMILYRLLYTIETVTRIALLSGVSHSLVLAYCCCVHCSLTINMACIQ